MTSRFLFKKIKNLSFLRIIVLTVIVSAFLISPSKVSAQKFEITPFGGYMFAGKLLVKEGDLLIKNNPNYGITFDITIRKDMQVELMYNRLDTDLNFRKIGGRGIEEKLFGLSVEYYQIGALYLVERGKLRPFGSISLGATQFNPKASGVESDWRFSFTAGAGIKYFFSKKIGIRLQGRLMVPVYWVSGGIYVGGGGLGWGLTSGSSLVQFDVTGGLIFAFGK